MSETHSLNLLRHPDTSRMATFAPGFGKRFLLVVDTEEEFDWSAPFARDNCSVTISKEMAAGQAWFEKAGVRPLYVCDYPIITTRSTAEMLRTWVAEGKADVGAHLHPWVNPPFDETVSIANSFAGNLPVNLEREKLRVLRDAILENIGKAPIAYRAGRYGIGPHSGAILRELGFLIDTSVRSRFSYANEGGPSFDRMPLRPWRLGEAGGLLELPLSTAYAGWARAAGDAIYPLAAQSRYATALLSKSRAISRIPLTPEGVSAKDAIRAIDALASDNLDLLLFSFHSPSLAIGHTPYIRSAEDLANFFAWWEQVLAHLDAKGYRSTNIEEISSAIR